jgi:hypothetical protein
MLLPMLLPMPLAACVLPLPLPLLYVSCCVFGFLSHPVPKHRRNEGVMLMVKTGAKAPTAHFGGCVYL